MTQATLKFTGVTKNPVKRKASPAQLAARQKFADMVRARAAAAKGKKMPRKNPSISHSINNLRTVKQMRDWLGIQTDGLTDGQVKALKNELIILGYGEYTAGQLPPKVFYNALNFATGRKTNPRKKTVSQKISQLEHEGYPHKQSIAIALSEQRKGKVKRNPMSAYTVFHRGTSNIAGQVMASGAETAKKMVAEKLGIPSVAYLIAKKETNKQGFYANNPSGEIGAYEITKNFKVLGIFKTKADAIKAAQGISDATGKTLAVKPVQVLAGHFDK